MHNSELCIGNNLNPKSNLSQFFFVRPIRFKILTCRFNIRTYLVHGSYMDRTDAEPNRLKFESVRFRIRSSLRSLHAALIFV